MKIKSLVITATLVLAAIVPSVTAQTNQTDQVETKAQRDARMAWWREAKFGMLITWGVYSVPAGFYHGKPVPGIGEWIMNTAKIPMAEYQQFARQFDPTNFNADAWVKTAKAAGMKYIIAMPKHHDGFAMFRTQASPWNIYDATPWHHDPMNELAAACRKYGLKLGFYYSQTQDWNNGGAADGGKWDPAQQHGMDDYIDKIAVPQVKEICSNYGPGVPAVIWWDTPYDMNRERAKKLYDTVEALKPDIIMNNRLGGGFKGDTETPEQRIPAQGFPDRDWETCMTINDTWGYKRDDDHWKSAATLIRNLCDIASKGGNYLLNVGPTSTGIIPQPEVDRLEAVGQWMKVNGEAIYGTTATPFGAELGKPVKAKDGYGDETIVSSANDWRCSSKPGKLYVMIFNWPPSGKFALPGLKTKVTQAYLLAGHKDLKFRQTAAGVTLDLPMAAPDKIASVICVKIADATAKVAAARPELKLPAIFGDNMVLQQQQSVPVWGWAAPGATVTVKFAGQTQSTRAGADGQWRVKLGKLKASFTPQSLVVEAGDTKVFTNLLVGEVWLASGQSNMEMPIGFQHDYPSVFHSAQELAAAHYPDIRLFKVERTQAAKPRADLEKYEGWCACGSNSLNALSFSAAAYFFGRDIYTNRNVPVGLIASSWGGTCIEPWTPPAGFQLVPSLANLATAPIGANARPYTTPTVLYNGMIAPLAGFAMRGVIWYQGEANRDDANYDLKMAALIGGWRKLWNEGAFPFYFVQIAPFKYIENLADYSADADPLPRFWLEQTRAARHIQNTGMVVTTDLVNDLNGIHPRDKQDVGHRLALLALHKTYGENVVCSGPAFRSMKISGNRAVLKFDHTNGGLASKDGQPLTWFAIAGADGKFVPADAKIVGQTVEVSAAGVEQPVAVRFAWNQLAQPNLVNGAGLPAEPFNTQIPVE